MDRNVFLLLIMMGAGVLFRRKVNWSGLFAANRWLFALFLYWLLSTVWSDFTLVSLKRWIKDVGNLIMVLLLLTDKNPVQTVVGVFARFAYLAIPFSVVFIKYFPELGRYYHPWTWEVGYCGVALDKNMLGCLLCVSGLIVIWELIEVRTEKGVPVDKLLLGGRLILLLMILWLLRIAQSTTALMCVIIGAGIFSVLRFRFAKSQARYLGTYVLILGAFIGLVYSVPGVLDSLVEALGEDVTLTGRTDLWADVLKQPFDPLLGTGYQSFWLGPGGKYMWEKYWFHPVQAHNGYIETYLNGGAIGLCLLLIMIVSTAAKLKREILEGSSYGRLCFSFVVVALFYNWTEASFHALNIIWIILLTAALGYRPTKGPLEVELAAPVRGRSYYPKSRLRSSAIAQADKPRKGLGSRAKYTEGSRKPGGIMGATQYQPIHRGSANFGMEGVDNQW